MSKIDSIYYNAIIEANKFGAKGWQVVGAEMSDRATDNYKIKLMLMRPIPKSASQMEWFDE